VPIAGALRTGDRQLESLGTLAGGIAHDFNNLLGGILSQTELALAELSEGASPEAEMKNIHAVAVRGAEIVRQLMVYAGQETDILELVDVSRLIEETVELLKVVVSKHADLQLRLSKDVPAARQPCSIAPDPGQPGDQRIRSHGRSRCGGSRDNGPNQGATGFTWIRGTGGRLSSARSIRYG
jgi:signal transduction histidine kinase